MDTFSHALWGRAAFGFKGYPKTALFFGCFPDLSSFGILIIINLFKNEYKIGPPELEAIPNWVFVSYDFGHSFITSLFFCLIVFFYNKKIAYAMLAWPLHVLLDFPFHSADYFPTPIFWPISSYKFDGIPWSNPFVFYPNIIGIIIIYFWRYKSINK